MKSPNGYTQNTKYYDKWNKQYYDAIVKRRYLDSDYDSKEFEKIMVNDYSLITLVISN